MFNSGLCQSTMLFGNDVYDLTSEIRVFFENQTVFADPVRLRLNESTEIDADITGHFGQRLRARALTKRITCSSVMKCSRSEDSSGVNPIVFPLWINSAT